MNLLPGLIFGVIEIERGTHNDLLDPVEVSQPFLQRPQERGAPGADDEIGYFIRRAPDIRRARKEQVARAQNMRAALGPMPARRGRLGKDRRADMLRKVAQRLAIILAALVSARQNHRTLRGLYAREKRGDSG